MGRKNTLEILATVLTRFGGKSVNLLVFIIVAHKLSLEEMAVYGAIFSLTLIYSAVLDLGVRNSVAVYIGQDPGRSQSYVRSAFLLWGLLTVAAVPVMYLTVDLLQNRDVFYSSMLLLGSMLYLRMMQGSLLGKGEIGLFNKTELASRVLLMVGTGTLLAIPDGFGLVSALWVLAVSQFGAALYLFLNQRSAIVSSWGGEAGLARRLVARGFVFMLSVLLMHASKRASFLVVSHLSTAEQSATFFALQRLTEVLTEVGMAVSVVMFSRNVRAADNVAAVRDTAQASRLTLAVLLVIGVFFALFSKWLVPLTLGSQYAGNDQLFHVLLLATLAGSLWVMLFPSMSVATSPLRVFLIMLPGAFLNLILAYLMTSSSGVLGAAWAMLASSCLTALLFVVTYKKRYGTGLLEFIVIRRSDISGIIGRFRGKIR